MRKIKASNIIVLFALNSVVAQSVNDDKVSERSQLQSTEEATTTTRRSLRTTSQEARFRAQTGNDEEELIRSKILITEEATAPLISSTTTSVEALFRAQSGIDDKELARSQILSTDEATTTRDSPTPTSQEGDETFATSIRNIDRQEFRRNKTAQAMKYKRAGRVFRPKNRRAARQVGVVDALKNSARYLNRWFVDMYKSKYPTSTIVINFYNSKIFERAYVSLCPRQYRVRFQVKTPLAFAVYFMTNTVLSQDYDHSDDLNTNFPNETLRITVGKISQLDVEDLLISVKSWPYQKIQETPRLIKYHPTARYHKQFQTLDFTKFQGYWVWWDQDGLIMMGREGEPPFISHFQPYNWRPRYLVFSNAFKEYSEINENSLVTITYVVDMEFPHSDKDCDCKERL